MYIRPRTPRFKRESGTLASSRRQEFYQLLDQDGIADDVHLFNGKLRESEDYYNYHPGRSPGRPNAVRAVTRKNES